jgi:hypothetical protein
MTLEPNAAFLTFTLDVTGTMDASTLPPTPGVVQTQAWLEVFAAAGSPDPDVVWESNGPHTEIWTVPVTPGVPKDMTIFFGTSIKSQDALLVDPYDFTGTVDFSQTATLTEILITDSSGVPIPGATLTAASGTDYPLSPLNSIPIPAAVWLFSSGLLGLIGISRRRKTV